MRGVTRPRARALRGAGLEYASLPILAREVLMRWESCLDTQSAGVLRAVFDGLISYLILSYKKRPHAVGPSMYKVSLTDGETLTRGEELLPTGRRGDEEAEISGRS